MRNFRHETLDDEAIKQHHQRYGAFSDWWELATVVTVRRHCTLRVVRGAEGPSLARSCFRHSPESDALVWGKHYYFTVHNLAILFRNVCECLDVGIWIIAVRPTWMKPDSNFIVKFFDRYLI